MHIRTAALCVLTLATLLMFQQCDTRVAHTSTSTSSQESAFGNGQPYDGKIYVSEERCPDATPVAKIKYSANGPSSLVKENCESLPQPVSIPQPDVQLDPADPSHLSYHGRQFVLEPIAANKVTYGDSIMFWDSSINAAITSPAFGTPMTSGDLVVCTVAYGSPNGTAQVMSLTDSMGNLYRRAIGPSGYSREIQVAGYTAEAWYAENVAGAGGLTVTALYSEPMRGQIQCANYHGVTPTNSLDLAMVRYETGVATHTLNAGVSNWNNEVVILATYGIAGVDSKFTLRSNGGGDNISDSFVTSAQPISAQITMFDAIAFLLTFKAKD